MARETVGLATQTVESPILEGFEKQVRETLDRDTWFRLRESFHEQGVRLHDCLRSLQALHF